MIEELSASIIPTIVLGVYSLSTVFYCFIPVLQYCLGMLNEDDVNAINSEHYAYVKWLRAEKNKILEMPSYTAKQNEQKRLAFQRLFPIWESSDDYLSGTVF